MSSSPSETEPTAVVDRETNSAVDPETNSKLKSVVFKVYSEGILGFYLHKKDKDELFRSFKNKTKELNISPNAVYAARCGCSAKSINDADKLFEIANDSWTIWASVSDEGGAENLPYGWAKLFCGQKRQTLKRRNENTTCCQSGTWDRSHSREINHRLPRSKVGSTVDSCRYHGFHPEYHGYHPEYHVGSSPCFGPYYEYPPSFCPQCSFSSMCPHCPYLGTCCDYGL